MRWVRRRRRGPLAAPSLTPMFFECKRPFAAEALGALIKEADKGFDRAIKWALLVARGVVAVSVS